MAKNFSVRANLAAEVDAFAAFFTHDSFPFVSGEFFRRQFDFHPLLREKIIVGDFAVSQHLLLVFIFDFRMHLARQRLRRFFGSNTNRFADADIDERRGNFSPIAKLQCPLAQAASSDDRNCIGGATVDFHESDKAFAIFAARIVDAEFLQTQHRQPHAEDLPGAKMSMRLFRITKVFVEGFHKASGQLSDFGSQLNTVGGQFLRQRMPSFVISTMIPAVVSSARNASEALKSRAVRAAFISAIFFSMSASDS